MSKVVLAQKPSFELPVSVSLLGGGKLDLNVTFKYRKLQDYCDWFEKVRSRKPDDHKTDAEMVLDVAEAWDADAAFTTEGIGKACNDVPGLGSKIVKVYVDEYERVRWGN
jgi:hypothetical protein